MIYQEFHSLDDYFKQSEGDKIVLNDIKYFSMEDREKINKALITVYDDNTISLIPSCDCGETKGAYLLHMKCDKCSTTVRNPHDVTTPLIWMHKLDEMPKFLSPHFWLMMRNVMGKKIDAMRWLADTSYNPPDVPDFLKIIQASFEGFERSYPHLISNIVNILNFLKNQSSFKTKRKAEIINGLIELYIKNEHIIYSNWLPMVNKKLFIMENTSKGRYTDLGIADVIDTTLQFIKTINEPKLTYNKKSNCMARTISDLTTIYNYYYKEYLSSKLGIFRKHLYGARLLFSARAVCTSISGPHRHNEIHLPWCIGVTALRPHIVNLLTKRFGYSYKEINYKMQRSVSNYDNEIDECLEILLKESNGGIPVLMQRN